MNSIPSDAQSVRSQATYSSGLPTFSQSSHYGSSVNGIGGYPNSVKRGVSSYASSTYSQDLGAETEGDNGSITYSQADRLRRNDENSSNVGSSIAHSTSDYKSQNGWDDDNGSSYSASGASGVTEY